MHEKALFSARAIFIALFCFLRPALAVNSADFVIVGGGTSGCVLAGKLCVALPTAKIVLIERASPRTPQEEFLVRSPRNGWEASGPGSPVAEEFLSLPNPGLNGRRIPMVTGNTLGGSSAINGMQWTVPLDRSINHMKVAGLNPGLAQRFFRRARRKLGVHEPPGDFKQVYVGPYIKSAADAGFSTTASPFSGKQRDAVWENRIAANNTGRRVDSCTAYLNFPGNACLSNLVLLQGETVSKLVIRNGRTVIGVEYFDSYDKERKKSNFVRSREEVLLAAGPYGSPKLLLQSGIGPTGVLARAGIKQVLDLAVGNMTQSRALNLFISVYNRTLEPSNDIKKLKDSSQRQSWVQGKKSIFGVAIGAANGIVGSKAYFAMSSNAGSPAHGLGLPLIASGCFTNPVSFGSISVESDDPFKAPLVQLNLMSGEKEKERVRACLKRMEEIHDKLPDHGLGIQHQKSAAELSSDVGLNQTTGWSWHFVGGCAVDKVVNGSLQITGLMGARVRVVDASALRRMPVSAGPMATTYMLAEYASERLIQSYRCQFKFGGNQCAAFREIW